MIEKGFVDAIINQIKQISGAFVLRPSDNFSLGIPDILASIPQMHTQEWDLAPVWMMAIEAKQMRPLMEDPFHKGRRTGKMLKHHFSGPQISMLREMKHKGWDAFGLVRASSSIAFRIDPKDIPSQTGNFTHEELMDIGHPIHRVTGRWQIERIV